MQDDQSRFPRLGALILPAACLALVLLASSGSTSADEAEGPGAAGEAGQARIQQMVDDLMPVVSKMRGLPWKQPVPAKVLTRDELGELLVAQLDRDVKPEEWTRDSRILKRLGMLRPEEDLRALVHVMFQSSIEGLYDPETKRMYVVSGYSGEALKPTILHELVHALDDQHLDLEKLEKPYRDDDPDRVFALRCIFEGGAEYARRRYQDAQPDVARAYYREQESRTDQQKDQLQMMKRVPTHMLLATMLHYRTGPNFVFAALGDDYPGGMRALFEDPPTTQEQCLYPYKWLGPKRDYPRTVRWGGDFAASMGPDWKKLDEESVGEIDLAVYMDYFLGDGRGRLNPRTMGEGQFVSVLASRAARGWDAGRTYYLESPGGHIVVLHAYAFDTPDDAREGARFLAATLHRSNGKAWKGAGWKPLAADAPGAGRHYDFVGAHGRGRILHRGREVLVLDGIRSDLFDRLWPVLAATRFEQDPRDRGDDPEDPFTGCVVVDRTRGLGLKLPRGWRGDASDAASPLAFATARHGGVEVDFTIIDQEVSRAGLPDMGKVLLGRMFDAKGTAPARVMGVQGLVHPLPAPKGAERYLYLASDAARTYVVMVGGPASQVQALTKDIELLLGGVPTPRADAPAPAPPSAGLRSIPLY